MNASIRSLVFVVLAGSVALAQAPAAPPAAPPSPVIPKGPPKPDPALAMMKSYSGNWTCELTSPASKLGAAKTGKIPMTVKLMPSNLWYEVSLTQGNSKSSGYWGYDSANRRFTRLGVNSDGRWDVASAPVDKDKLAWIGELYNDGRPRTPFRHTLTRKSDTEITWLDETQVDNAWITASSGSCKKQ